MILAKHNPQTMLTSSTQLLGIYDFCGKFLAHAFLNASSNNRKGAPKTKNKKLNDIQLDHLTDIQISSPNAIDINVSLAWH